ncbi:ABC transporter permease [Lacticaseibacillus daqingensis]|uniref:ABC transporter permease n=1 Tax=Lacticaseibacillus daqingensis TaxID=2486014 RepID=UPI000F7750C4|nr:ABC transporter permease [Lacticaseibacillus daqingensis]
MGTLIQQEWYKLTHKLGTWLAIGFMVLVQVAMAVLAAVYPDSPLFNASTLVENSYIGGDLVMFIAIASVASIVSMEFQYGTMKQLLYRQYYRSQVFLSKVVVAVLQFLILQVIAAAMTVVLSLIGGKYDWFATAKNVPHWQTYALGQAGTLLMGLLLLSVVLMLSTLFKTNAAAIASGFIGYFVITIAAGILIALIAKWEWLKWNPFTFLMTGNQLVTPALANMTHLTTPVMVVGSLVYTVLFGLIAYASFRKRSI